MIAELLGYFIAAGLLKCATRRHNKPRPGKTKLPKWPSRLCTVQVYPDCMYHFDYAIDASIGSVGMTFHSPHYLRHFLHAACMGGGPLLRVHL